MLSDEEFKRWCDRVNLSEEAREVVDQARSIKPIHSAGDETGELSSKYFSRRIGMVIQFSSLVELPCIYGFEEDPNVLEYYDQPPPVVLTYSSRGSGYDRQQLYTPNFFVIGIDWAGWVECRSKEEMMKLPVKGSERYRRENGLWRCPSAENYAKQFGLFFLLKIFN